MLSDIFFMSFIAFAGLSFIFNMKDQ